jgi:membrane protein DedA with SNARE-associated domain
MIDLLLAQQGNYIYISLALALLAGSIGLPIPEDFPLIVAGIILHKESIDPILLFCVCYTSIILGDLIIYRIGHYFGPKLFEVRFLKHRLKPQMVRFITSRLDKHALWMIFLARHLFYFRTITFLLCGAFRMNYYKFIFYDLISALVSVPLIMYFGYTAYGNLPIFLEFLGKVKFASLFCGLFIVAAGYYFFRGKCKS